MTDRRTGIIIGLVLGIAAVVLFLFVLSDDTVDAPAVDETTQVETTITGEEPEKKDPPAEPPPEPPLLTINVAGGQPEGGVQTIETEKGQEIAFQVRADAPEHVHVHGYDLFEDVEPGRPAKFSFVAEIDGIFEVELEDSAVPILELRVTP